MNLIKAGVEPRYQADIPVFPAVLFEETKLIGDFGIRGCYCASIPSCAEIFRRIETEAGDIAKRANLTTFPTGSVCLSTIFDDFNSGFPRQIDDVV